MRCHRSSPLRVTCAGEDGSSVSLHARLRELVRVQHTERAGPAQRLASTSMCHIGRTESSDLSHRALMQRSVAGVSGIDRARFGSVVIRTWQSRCDAEQVDSHDEGATSESDEKELLDCPRKGAPHKQPHEQNRYGSSPYPHPTGLCLCHD